MDILTIIQKAHKELGITAPTAALSSTDEQTMQFLALAEACGQEWVSDFAWQQLTKEHAFEVLTQTEAGCVVVAGSGMIVGISDTSQMEVGTWQVTGAGLPENCTIESIDSPTQVTITPVAETSVNPSVVTFTKTKYPLPNDWNSQIDRTNWDRDNNWEMIGPKTPQERQWLKSGIVSTGPRLRFWYEDNQFVIWPIANNSGNLVYEYITENWIKGNGSNDLVRASFANDDDEVIFRDRLMIAAIKYKFFAIKGFDTTTLWTEYDRELCKAKAQSSANPTLSLGNKNQDNIFLSPANVPDGNVYGQ